MMEAITKAGCTEPQAIVDAIAATDGDFVCGPVKFDANHTAALTSSSPSGRTARPSMIWPEGEGAVPAHLPDAVTAVRT